MALKRFWMTRLASDSVERAAGGSAPEIVEGHGGVIDLRSALGEGSTFIVELPLGASVRPRESASFAFTGVLQGPQGF